MPLSAYAITGASIKDEAIPSGEELGLLWNTLFDARVEFIHRTAADFLTETEDGRKIINSDRASACEIRAKIVRSQLVRTLMFRFPWYDNGSNTSDDILILIDNSLPDDMRRSLQILTGDIYERMLTKAPVMEHIIAHLHLQIRHRQFDAALYRSLCEFTGSALAKNSSISSLVYRSDKVDNVSKNRGSQSWTTLKMLPYIREASILTLDKYNAEPLFDVSQDFNWPNMVPRIQVPRHASVSSDDLRNFIAGHLSFTSWILVNARRVLQYEIAEMAVLFLRDAVTSGLVEVIQRWFERRRGPYDEIDHFEERLMHRAKTPEMQKLLETVLQSGAKVGDPVDREDLSIGFVQDNQEVIYKALFPGMNRFDDAEVDVPNCKK